MGIRSFEDKIPLTGKHVYIDQSADVIGDVTLSDDSSIWPRCVLRGDVQAIRVGARSNIQDGTILHVTHDSHYQPGGFACEVGQEVTVGHGVILHACQVGDGCLIGMGSVVLDGAVLESGVLLAAGSLVSPGKVLAGGFLWRGRPAQKVRPLTDEEEQYLRYAAEHYVRLKNRHLSQAS